MNCTKINFGCIHIGSNRAYVYIWFSKTLRFAYIGQTNDRYGTLGRACGHLQATGSLRNSCSNRLGYSLDSAADLTLCSFLLPEEQIFISVESSYREAIEYLVQMKFYDIRADLVPTLKVISNVRTNNRVTEKKIEQIADSIINSFLQAFNSETK